MKTRLYIMIAMILSLVACEKPEIEIVHLNVYTQYITFNSGKDSENVKMEAAQKPSVQTPSWITATVKKEDNGQAMWSMTLDCSKNNGTTERKGTVIVTCLDESASISVTQRKREQENNEENKDEDPDKPAEKDTPESILIAVQDSYVAESWSETDSDITVVFHEPHPIDLIEKYPEGIKDVKVAKSNIKRFDASDECLEFVFISGRTATIKMHKTPLASPESILLAVQESYRLYSVKETEADITVFFHEPEPVRLGQNYPNGIESVTVSREDLKSYQDLLDRVLFEFKSGKKVTIKAANIPMEIELNEEEVVLQCSDPETFEWNKISVGFSIKCCRPENLTVTAEDMRSWTIAYPDGDVTEHPTQPTVAMNEDGTSGTLTILAQMNSDIIDNIRLTADNRITKATKEIKYTLVKTHYGLTEEQVRTGLTALYNACNGPAWTKQANWLTDAPINQWEGVVYSGLSPFNDGKGRHIMTFSIEICDENIKGVIPDEFWELCPYARKIAFWGGADFTGSTMPEKAWGEFLYYVDFSKTQIQADINHAKECHKLQVIYMYGCNLAPLKAEFFNSTFPDLKILDLEFENPSPLPANIGNLAKSSPFIKDLILTNLEGECPEDIFNITSLKRISLTGKIIGDIPASIEKMKNLNFLAVDLYSKSGKIPNEIGNCKKLRVLQFGNCITEYPEAMRYIPGGWNMRGGLNSCLWNYKQVDMEGNEYELPMPEWFAVRYGSTKWTNQTKPDPVWPNADDLEHPADEIFWVDGQWQHRPDMKYTDGLEDDDMSNIP
ncbi:MAG: hypothetical protein IJ504_01370 [Bacteroidales bacterium]|nr:hypothetical protein [Bacteroidales bacterium]